MTVAVIAAATALLCWPGRTPAAHRLRPLLEIAADAQSVVQLRRPVVLLAAGAVLALLVVGGSPWIVLLLAGATVVGGRVRPVDRASPDEIPMTADLMAACLTAGAGIADALSAALAAAGPWLRTRGAPVVGALRAGSPAEEAWADWLTDDQLAPIARTSMRTSGSGAAAASELVRVAARLRAAVRAQRQQRVARAAVWIVFPLGLCFLPAFVAVGVVPLVVSLVEQLR
jgi:Flp pilus assembly protein TadB